MSAVQQPFLFRQTVLQPSWAGTTEPFGIPSSISLNTCREINWRNSWRSLRAQWSQIFSAAAGSSVLAAHEYCHGVSLRRHSCLWLTSLKPEAQHHIQNLPFSGSTVFGIHAYNEIVRMKMDMDKLKAVGLEKPREQRKSIRPYQRRFYSQRVPIPPWLPGRSQHQRSYQSQLK